MSNNMVTDTNEIDVSFVMTVYNKEFYLPSVLEALLNQSGLKNPEFIFIDDVSKDKSVEIIRNRTQNIPNVTIVAKEKNEGISITINQGIMRAKGKWIRMLDSDDILPLDSTEKMIALANKHNADIVYGLFKKTGLEPEELTKEKTPDDFDYEYKEDAFNAVLNGRFTRMGQLIKREVLQKANGADERVFIQDESIPLRASRYANGIIKMYTNVVLVPRETNNLSKNTNQLDNDRFFAHYNLLLDYYKEMDKSLASKVYEKALSANWKYVKKNLKGAYLRSDFFHYLKAKLIPQQPNFKLLEKYAQRFQTLPNVLRSKK
jgi:glycosyltransferase involved in cell wall biosynthesis